jgi:dTDP-4-amino-4,6-dideoxygalactose transaminase
MMTKIEYEQLGRLNEPFFTEIKLAVNKVIESGWYILGREVELFEIEFAQWVGAKYCVGVANGLDALTLSLRALELPAGSEVLVPSNTYIATILAILHAGHKPVLVEPNEKTLNIDWRQLPAKLTHKTKALCLVHLYGSACDMKEILEFSSAHGLAVVEDCAQSHGATYANVQTGTFGQAGCFSFYPTKNLGAMGDAGAVVTDDERVAHRLKYLRNYGSAVKYHNKFVGYNSRLDEIQAAILRVKLKYLNQINEYKNHLANVYFANLCEDYVLPHRSAGRHDVYHIFPIRTPRRDELRTWLADRGVKTEIHYPLPPHRQEAMVGLFNDDYPIAEKIHKQILSLPISFANTTEDVMTVCRLLNEFSKN